MRPIGPLMWEHRTIERAGGLPARVCDCWPQYVCTTEARKRDCRRIYT